MSDKERTFRHTAYDDAFRTIETECDDALIHFVNYVFHENYDKTAKIVRLRNEHLFERKTRKDEKRITDSHFSISYHGRIKKYHMECESSGYDGSLLVRLFQYAIQIAIDEGELMHSKIILDLPYTGLLVLRKKGIPSEKVEFEIHTPGGVASYPVPVICEADYSIDELFEKKLFFLIPFFAFNFEDKMDTYESDEKELAKFVDIYCDIIERLRQLKETVLSLRTKGVIINQMENVTRRLNKNRKKVSRKVGDIMGGRVLKMDWLERYDAAVASGRAEGRAEGDQARLISQICRKLRKKKTISQIADELEEDEIRVKVICDTAAGFAPDYVEEQVIKAVLDPVDD